MTRMKTHRMTRCAALATAVCAAAAAAAAPHKAKPAPVPSDLSGGWSSLSGTDFERPDRFKHLVLTPEEAAAYERLQNDPDLLEKDFKAMREKSGRPPPPDVGAIHVEYFEKVKLLSVGGQVHSSLLVFPEDGQLPYSSAGKLALKAARKREMRDFSNPEARPVEERCLLGSGEPLGPPLDTVQANANYVIVQTKDTVAIEGEMNHDVRVIRLNAPHGPAQVRPWMGDSTGVWQGDTLVVETVHFNPAESYETTSGGTYILSDQARVTEWFTRISKTEILYRFSVDDPKTYTKPWAGEMILKAQTAPMLEFACHEGNYALRGILAGARKVESEGKTPEPLDGGDPPPKPAAGAGSIAKPTS